jgi:hypothetical protein
VRPEAATPVLTFVEIEGGDDRPTARLLSWDERVGRAVEATPRPLGG